VVQGVEIVDGRVIFYGLGNLLHPGMQNMSAFGMCQDYGLMAKLHLLEDATGRFRVRAIEAIPLTDMHWIARRMPARQAAERIHVLNHLAAALDAPSAGAKGVRFAPRADGSGLYCAADAHTDSGSSGALCAGWQGATEPPTVLKARIASACGSRPLIAGRSGGGSVKGRADPGAIASSPVAPASATAPAAWARQVFAGD
jgi:poly-gamma-glutamate synthesis protein (capsule biosynthesis protein)